MFYANKKTVIGTPQAQLTAKILATVKELLDKEIIAIHANIVSLPPKLWKDEPTALNWIKCLHIYCTIKKHIREKDPLYFNNIHTGERIATMINKKPKLLNFTFA